MKNKIRVDDILSLGGAPVAINHHFKKTCAQWGNCNHPFGVPEKETEIVCPWCGDPLELVSEDTFGAVYFKGFDIIAKHMKKCPSKKATKMCVEIHGGVKRN